MLFAPANRPTEPALTRYEPAEAPPLLGAPWQFESTTTKPEEMTFGKASAPRGVGHELARAGIAPMETAERALHLGVDLLAL